MSDKFDKFTTLHPEGDTTIDLYPNVRDENIPQALGYHEFTKGLTVQDTLFVRNYSQSGGSAYYTAVKVDIGGASVFTFGKGSRVIMVDLTDGTGDTDLAEVIKDMKTRVQALEDSGGTGVTVDDAMSTTSENPVQNKVITQALSLKQDTLTPGNGISIEGNVISATGGGGGGSFEDVSSCFTVTSDLVSGFSVKACKIGDLVIVDMKMNITDPVPVNTEIIKLVGLSCISQSIYLVNTSQNVKVLYLSADGSITSLASFIPSGYATISAILMTA